MSRREPIETGRGSRAYGGKSCDGLCSGQIGRTFDLSPHIAKGAKRPRPDGTGADDGRADGTGGGKKGGPDPAKAAEGHMANGSWEAWHRTVPRYWAL
ncbi:MAG: hypothetical protein FWF71_05720 [Actinomycetia bacterium]|nr:hypothetical protein [Actinomycetes bacterium]